MKRIFWFPIIPGITRETLNINLGGHKGPGVPDASAIWIQDWFWFVQTRSIFIDGMLTSVTASCWHSELCDSFKTNSFLAAVRRIVETPGAGGDTFVMLWQKHTNHINILTFRPGILLSHCVWRLTAKDLIVRRDSKEGYLNNYLPSTSCFMFTIRQSLRGFR